MNVIATWFYGDSPASSTYFPQVSLQSHTDKSKRIYWDCIWVFYVCAKKTNPECRFIFFYGGLLSKYGDAVLVKLRETGIDVICLDYTYKPPAGFSMTFGNQMFIFNILDWVADSTCAPDTVWCILDSDCLVLADLSQMWADARACRGLTYDLNLPIDENINGINRMQLASICREEGWGDNNIEAQYFGGEYFCAIGLEVSSGQKSYKTIIKRSYERWKENTSFCTEEAHMLSCWYRDANWKVATANIYIKRMWTGFRYRNIDPADVNLPIWHLPVEKKMGIARFFRFLEKGGKIESLSSIQFRQLIAKFMGIPRRSLLKLVEDVAIKLNEKI